MLRIDRLIVFIAEQLTRAVKTVAIRGVSLNLSFIILPIQLTEFPAKSFAAVSLTMFVAFVK